MTRLFDQSAMSDPTRVPDWLLKEYELFHAIVTNDRFPCTFGLAAERERNLRYSFVEGNDLTPLPNTLRSFLCLSRSHPTIKHNLTVFFEPEAQARSFEYYRKQFWSVLNFLHGYDGVAWPIEIPTDTAHPGWEFCFDGDAIFLFAASPAYMRRRSRNYGNSFIMLFQPKRIFRGIESELSAGVNARRVIRARLEKWDGQPSDHPDTIEYGEALTYRWRQYFLTDDNSAAKGACPFRFKEKADSQINHTSIEGENDKCNWQSSDC